MSKIITVAKWEFLEKIKTRSFLISLVLTPLIIIGFSVVPALLAGKDADNTKALGIIDMTGSIFPELREEIGSFKLPNHQPAYIPVNLFYSVTDLAVLKKSADSLLLKGRMEGVLVIEKKNDDYYLEYRSTTAGSLKDKGRIEKAFNKVRIKKSLNNAGLPSSSVDELIKEIEVKQIKLDKTGKESNSSFIEIFFSSIIFIMILTFVIISSGGTLIRSVLEEKSNRLIEIIVSSCRPGELLMGKILGLSMLGMFQIAIWTMIGITLAGNKLIPLAAFNNIIPMLIYFILGFFLYTSLFVGIGSIVSTEQEAHQVTGYLSMLLFLPIIFAVSAIENPDSGLVRILTYIPFTTPTIMLLKLNVKSISMQEYFVTITLLIFSITIIIIVTSKIFRIGILSYGKAPSLKQLIQWMREE